MVRMLVEAYLAHCSLSCLLRPILLILLITAYCGILRRIAAYLAYCGFLLLLFLLVLLTFLDAAYLAYPAYSGYPAYLLILLILLIAAYCGLLRDRRRSCAKPITGGFTAPLRLAASCCG